MGSYFYNNRLLQKAGAFGMLSCRNGLVTTVCEIGGLSYLCSNCHFGDSNASILVSLNRVLTTEFFSGPVWYLGSSRNLVGGVGFCCEFDF
jgi:hypothetical protein